MKKTLILKRFNLKLIVVMLLLLPIIGMAQITPFTMTLTPTHQTCTGNGAITMDINGTQNGATFDFSIYQLPNTITPVRLTSGVPATGLTLSHLESFFGAGNYRVVATQNFGALTNSVTKDVTASVTSYLGNEVMWRQKYYPASGQLGQLTDDSINVNGTTITSTKAMSMNKPNSNSELVTITG